MSICAHAWAGYRICALHDDVGTMFLATEDGEDSAAGPLQCTYLRSQVHERVLNAADGWQL